ncbi:hypothetical protein [Actinoallomurus rhizosphaericola]|uniref:hypothetical protein n=1 Tax=Actinoallomurus rhizosphaericola TaxID=2952536 RepID=UPI002091B08E|nr:hypothetical protein [Actinoallomurus rhizosphaericola]MCO5992618.1 hypothetical protein [Actinoallomurus rhizosphaericola]
MFRPRAFAPAVVAAGVLLAGCGGGGHKTAGSASPSAPRPSASPSPTPSYTSGRVKAALLSAEDIDSHVAPVPPSTPALQRRAVPSCSLSAIKPSGSPDAVVRQFRASRYSGANFGQIALTYPDAAAAAAMFATIRAKVTACPSSRHVPQKTLSGGSIALAHDDTWHPSEETTPGWAHVRGTERTTISPSSSVINVFYRIYDYVSRGNVVLVSMYWERVAPKASADKVARKATSLLTKQLARLP